MLTQCRAWWVHHQNLRDIRQCLRPGQDWFARIGEDRFVLVLPRTRLEGAERMARKLRRRVADMPVIIENAEDAIIASSGAPPPFARGFPRLENL